MTTAWPVTLVDAPATSRVTEGGKWDLQRFRTPSEWFGPKSPWGTSIQIYHQRLQDVEESVPPSDAGTLTEKIDIEPGDMDFTGMLTTDADDISDLRLRFTYVYNMHLPSIRQFMLKRSAFREDLITVFDDSHICGRRKLGTSTESADVVTTDGVPFAVQSGRLMPTDQFVAFGVIDKLTFDNGGEFENLAEIRLPFLGRQTDINEKEIDPDVREEAHKLLVNSGWTFDQITTIPVEDEEAFVYSAVFDQAVSIRTLQKKYGIFSYRNLPPSDYLDFKSIQHRTSNLICVVPETPLATRCTLQAVNLVDSLWSDTPTDQEKVDSMLRLDDIPLVVGLDPYYPHYYPQAAFEPVELRHLKEDTDYTELFRFTHNLRDKNRVCLDIRASLVGLEVLADEVYKLIAGLILAAKFGPYTLGNKTLARFAGVHFDDHGAIIQANPSRTISFSYLPSGESVSSPTLMDALKSASLAAKGIDLVLAVFDPMRTILRSAHQLVQLNPEMNILPPKVLKRSFLGSVIRRHASNHRQTIETFSRLLAYFEASLWRLSKAISQPDELNKINDEGKPWDLFYQTSVENLEPAFTKFVNGLEDVNERIMRQEYEILVHSTHVVPSFVITPPYVSATMATGVYSLVNRIVVDLWRSIVTRVAGAISWDERIRVFYGALRYLLHIRGKSIDWLESIRDIIEESPEASGLRSLEAEVQEVIYVAELSNTKTLAERQRQVYSTMEQQFSQTVDLPVPKRAEDLMKEDYKKLEEEKKKKQGELDTNFDEKELERYRRAFLKKFGNERFNISLPSRTQRQYALENGVYLIDRLAGPDLGEQPGRGAGIWKMFGYEGKTRQSPAPTTRTIYSLRDSRARAADFSEILRKEVHEQREKGDDFTEWYELFTFAAMPRIDREAIRRIQQAEASSLSSRVTFTSRLGDMVYACPPFFGSRTFIPSVRFQAALYMHGSDLRKFNTKKILGVNSDSPVFQDGICFERSWCGDTHVLDTLPETLAEYETGENIGNASIEYDRSKPIPWRFREAPGEGFAEVKLGGIQFIQALAMFREAHHSVLLLVLTEKARLARLVKLTPEKPAKEKPARQNDDDESDKDTEVTETATAKKRKTTEKSRFVEDEEDESEDEEEDEEDEDESDNEEESEDSANKSPFDGFYTTIVSALRKHYSTLGNALVIAKDTNKKTGYAKMQEFKHTSYFIKSPAFISLELASKLLYHAFVFLAPDGNRTDQVSLAISNALLRHFTVVPAEDFTKVDAELHVRTALGNPSEANPIICYTDEWLSSCLRFAISILAISENQFEAARKFFMNIIDVYSANVDSCSIRAFESGWFKMDDPTVDIITGIKTWGNTIQKVFFAPNRLANFEDVSFSVTTATAPLTPVARQRVKASRASEAGPEDESRRKRPRRVGDRDFVSGDNEDLLRAHFRTVAVSERKQRELLEKLFRNARPELYAQISTGVISTRLPTILEDIDKLITSEFTSVLQKVFLASIWRPMMNSVLAKPTVPLDWILKVPNVPSLFPRNISIDLSNVSAPIDWPLELPETLRPVDAALIVLRTAGLSGRLMDLISSDTKANLSSVATDLPTIENPEDADRLALSILKSFDIVFDQLRSKEAFTAVHHYLKKTHTEPVEPAEPTKKKRSERALDSFDQLSEEEQKKAVGILPGLDLEAIHSYDVVFAIRNVLSIKADITSLTTKHAEFLERVAEIRNAIEILSALEDASALNSDKFKRARNVLKGVVSYFQEIASLTNQLDGPDLADIQEEIERLKNKKVGPYTSSVQSAIKYLSKIDASALDSDGFEEARKALKDEVSNSPEIKKLVNLLYKPDLAQIQVEIKGIQERLKSREKITEKKFRGDLQAAQQERQEAIKELREAMEDDLEEPQEAVE
jgi:predicted negative regulator of RcsB-dependent stress response